MIKITDKVARPNTCLFEDLEIGEFFLLENELYIKISTTEEVENALNLPYQNVEDIAYNQSVIPTGDNTIEITISE